MSGASVMIVLRIVHVLMGLFWVGAAIMVALFLMPAVRALGPTGGRFMAQLTGPQRLPIWIMMAAILTVLSGGALYWRNSGGFTSAWMHTPSGMAFGVGGALAIVSFVIGLLVNKPTAERMGAILATVQAAGGSPSAEQAAELARLQQRLYVVSIESAVVLALATAAMACARYLG